MSNPAPEERSGREIRLLMLVIVVAVAGLLVLARFRFPTADIVMVSPTPTPLERLTVRAPFEDLANTVAAAAVRVRPVVAVVEIEPPEEPAARPSGKAASKAAPDEEPAPAPRLFGPALRVAPGRLLMYVTAGARPAAADGEPVQVIGEDASRAIVLVAASPAEDLGAEVVDFVGAVPSFGGSSYVLAVEAAAGGPVSRPVFIPRVDPAAAQGWETLLLRIGGTPPVPAGVFLFTIDGRLIGLTIAHDSGIAIVGAAALDRLAGQLAQAEAGAPAEPEVPGGGK